ncbi:hypothetical protein A2160_04095 [Candidatus Beckwithbacteria bacterium RBG_13_42_9]|uniref:Transposase IS200-like domain-containing protein n=1 Tax=Candidatus Beckwithbacteria bacterium RBG_13_42_9 TaxID=1797457 RepID=A0A1F5E6M9_9BACT|nr:MAG: hypothetical protein A2160_04095 [Candidatus Beckwithbacteria bacterium RBG_13_42_9]
MPGKNIVKTYVENGFYHLYNRGVEKRDIFLDDYDYSTFLFYLKFYLTPPSLLQEKDKVEPNKKKKIRLNINQVSLYNQIKLISYCLMPNHFHLLVKQTEKESITKFTRRLLTAYSMVFNKRHHRVGTLFQGRYKAVLVENDGQLLQLSRYIHRNPISLAEVGPIHFVTYPYSSLNQYLGIYQTFWLSPRLVLNFFRKNGPQADYLSFVTENETEDEVFFLNRLTLDA